MKQILRTDEGPDLQVDTGDKLARADITCGKSGKLVGYVEVYRGSKNLVIYVHDKRKPLGRNRQAFIALKSTPPAELMQMVGGGYGLKEALRRAGLVDEAVLLDADSAGVEANA